MANQELLASLVRRLEQARAKGRLEELLRQSRADQQLSRRAFRTSGTMEALAEAVQTAAEKGALTPETLARVVDEVEENGGQHIYMFDLTEKGVALARSSKLLDAFPQLPARPTVAMYADLPSASRTYVTRRENGIVIVKQIFKASFWEKDQQRSYARDDERATFMVRRDRRAINLLLLDPVRRQAEIRIDRVRGQQDDELARDLFMDFRGSLGDTIKLPEHLLPTPIWNGFGRIVSDLETTYMTTDSAQDPSVLVHISNRRAGDRGTDVRKHESYQYATTDYTRGSLNIYWLIQQGSEEKIHTLLSRVKHDDGVEYAKVYVAAKVTPEELDNVLERIRQPARDAS